MYSAEHFRPTSTHANWKGKIQCAYCNQKGWPADSEYANPRHWTLKHGENCKHREK